MHMIYIFQLFQNKYFYELIKMTEILSSLFSSSIGKIFLIDIGIQWVGWVVAVAFKTEKFYDLTGTV